MFRQETIVKKNSRCDKFGIILKENDKFLRLSFWIFFYIFFFLFSLYKTSLMSFQYPIVLDGGFATELEKQFKKDLSGM